MVMMPFKIHQNSSRFPLPYASLTKFRKEKLMNSKQSCICILFCNSQLFRSEFCQWTRRQKSSSRIPAACKSSCLLFCSSHFWFLVTFVDEVMKIQKYYIIFIYILQGEMSQTENKEKKITQPK